MNCKFHPTAEAVTKCADCGAKMCSSCDTHAFFRTEKGALCLECSLERAQHGIEWKTNYLKKLKRKLIFASIFIVLAIIFFIDSDLWLGAFLWLLCGLIQTWGQEKDEYSVKSVIWGKSDEEEFSFEKAVDEFSFTKFIIKLVFYAIAAPIMLIRNFIDYFGTKGMKKEEIQKYEEINTTLNEADKKAFEFWKNDAEKGDSFAQAQVAFFYHEGAGIEQNYEKAFEWAKKSADQGDANGQYNLADFYFHGEGVTQNYEKAIELWTKAAEQGDERAQFNLGLCYYEGTGIEKDFATAAKWWALAAEQGFADAQRDLGLCYEEGKGVIQNHETAVKLWKLAAEQGDEKAQQCLQQYS